MKLKFPAKDLSNHCSNRAPGFREAVMKACQIENENIVIEGEQWAKIAREHFQIPKKTFGLGDAVAALANPIARASDAIFGTSLVGCSSCAERQAALNKLLPNLGKSPKSDAQ